MKKIFFLTAIIGLVMATTAFAKPLTLNEISEAACRVSVVTGTSFNKVEYSNGTGTCIGKSVDGEYFYVLTNAHVVEGNRTGTVEFFKSGRVTKKLPAEVIWRAFEEKSDVDFAIMRVKSEYFGKYPPRIIQIAPEGYGINKGDYVAAVGCPNARWANGWEGHILGKHRNNVVFLPAPVGGQSGSGLTVLVRGKDGKLYTRVGAIVTWRIDEDPAKPIGGAIQMSSLHRTIKGVRSSHSVPSSYKHVSKKCSLGSDNRLYEVVREYDGSESISFGQRPNVSIRQFNYCSVIDDSINVSHLTEECGRDYTSLWRGFGSRPRGQPAPVFPRTPEPVPPGNGDPYGVPPNIGGQWPGAVDEPPVIEVPLPDEADAIPVVPPIVVPGADTAKLEQLAKDYLKLKEDKKDLAKQIVDLNDKIEKEKAEAIEAAAAKKADEDAALAAEAAKPVIADKSASDELEPGPVGIFAKIKNRLSGIFGGILIASGVGLLILVWKKFIRPALKKRVDSLQDYVQNKVAEKHGVEAGKNIRGIMEGVEDAILGFADDFIEDINNKEKVAKAAAKGKIADKVVESNTAKKDPTSDQIKEAIKLASKEIGGDDITTAVPARVDEIIKKAMKEK